MWNMTVNDQTGYEMENTLIFRRAIMWKVWRLMKLRRVKRKLCNVMTILVFHWLFWRKWEPDRGQGGWLTRVREATFLWGPDLVTWEACRGYLWEEAWPGKEASAWGGQCWWSAVERKLLEEGILSTFLMPTMPSPILSALTEATHRPDSVALSCAVQRRYEGPL